MKRSEHLNVVDLDNRLVLRSDDKDITCNFSDLGIDSSHIFVDECNRMIYEAKKVFIDKQSHRELYVVNQDDNWYAYWVKDSGVIGSDCCTICSVNSFLREKSRFFCGDIVSKYDGGVPIYCFVDAFTDVSGVFTVVFSYLDSDGKIAHCYSDKGMYRVREEVAFEHWLSRGFKYDDELTDNSYVFYCSDEPFSFLANRKIGTYGFAKNKFPFIVPFHKFNPDNIGESLQHNVVKQ